MREAKLGRFTEIKERVQFIESELGDYSYIERHSEAIYTIIGKFSAVASDVRLNALEHPIERVVRLALGGLLVGAAATGAVGAWGYIGIVPILTGLLGRCPLYSVFGISTCPTRKRLA